MLLVKLNVLKSLNKAYCHFIMKTVVGLSGVAISSSLYAQEKVVQVGKHANTQLDAGAMVLSLLVVLAVIVISALILKKFQIGTQSVSGMKVITSLSLGPKERLVVVEVQQQQLLLGVSGQQINLLKVLDEPLTAESITTQAAHNGFNSTLLKLLTKTSNNNDKN